MLDLRLQLDLTLQLDLRLQQPVFVVDVVDKFVEIGPFQHRFSLKPFFFFFYTCAERSLGSLGEEVCDRSAMSLVLI